MLHVSLCPSHNHLAHAFSLYFNTYIAFLFMRSVIFDQGIILAEKFILVPTLLEKSLFKYIQHNSAINREICGGSSFLLFFSPLSSYFFTK